MGEINSNQNQFKTDSNSQDVLLYLQEFRNEFHTWKPGIEKRLTRIEDYLSGNRYGRGENSRIDEIEKRLMRIEDKQLTEDQRNFVVKTYTSARSWKSIGGGIFTIIMAVGGLFTAIYYALKIIAPKFFS